MAKKINITKEQLIYVKNNFESRKEMAEYLNISLSCLDSKFKEIGIRFNKHNVINDSDFQKYYQEGLNDREIGEKLGISGKRIQEYRSKCNLPSNSKKILSFSNNQYQIFLGGMYGDSYIGIPNDSKNVYFTFRHSLAQKEYCLWKYEQLKNLCFSPQYSSQYDKRTGKTYSGITIRSYCNELFTPYLEKFYHIQDNKKIKYINEELFSTIEPLGLAIWFQDDGYRQGESYAISTNNFSEEDWNIISKVLLNKFDVHITKWKSNVSYISAKSVKIFHNLIIPYIHDNCKYKLLDL